MGMVLDLYPYQQAAMDMFMGRGSLLLALDTGMGKTATAIAICEDLLERRLVRSCLLVVPANLKYQWAKAISQVTDIPSRDAKVKRQKIRIPEEEYCVIIDGTPERRAKIYVQAKVDRPEYIIVGYDNVETDYNEHILGLNPEMTVLDEASLIKTPTSDRARTVKSYLRSPYRLALTATPVENVPLDVFSIMEWVDKKTLGRWDLFDRSYLVRNDQGSVIGAKNLHVLNTRLSQGMYRKSRLDPDVQGYLPDVREHAWEVRTSPEILREYVSMCRDLIDAYDGSPARGRAFRISDGPVRPGKRESRGQIMAIHTAMEMLLDAPWLIEYSAGAFMQSQGQGSRYAWDLIQKGFRPPDEHPKLDLVVSRVHDILSEDPAAKVIVFCRYRGILSILKQDFHRLGHASVEYHGEMSLPRKEAAVDAFLNDPERRILLSTHAGAYGIDLPVANWLINIDTPWGYGIKTQLNGRHVRASSEFPCVNVVNVITTGTIEARKAGIQEYKGGIASAIVDGDGRATITRDVEALVHHARAIVAESENET